MVEKIIVGDIHGDINLLNKVISYVEKNNIPDENVIFLGDYVDRGKNSKQVLNKLMNSNYTCLMGNHDLMLLDFVDSGDYLSIYNDWNLNTISSFYNIPLFEDGVGGIYTIELTGESSRMNETIRSWLAKEPTIEWLRSLDYMLEDDEYIYVHAGLDFTLDEPRNTADVEKVWLRPSSIHENTTGKKIIVGHTMVDEITFLSNDQIMIDCGNSYNDTSWVYSTTKGVINCE